jgi:hypothetical protein
MRIRSPLFLVMSFLVVLAGGWTSYAVFHLLAANIRPPEKHKDTVLVQVLGAAAYNPALASRPDSAINRNPNQPISSSTQTKDDTTKTRIGGFTRIDSFRRPPAAIPIPADSLARAVTSGKLALAAFPWWLVILAALIVMAVLFYILYYRLPFLSAEMRQDLDPPQLTKILRKYSAGIESLGNPRKIKRLSNKIRFQYHYLVAKGFQKSDELDFLAGTLLALEVQKTVTTEGSAVAKSIMLTETGFKNFLSGQPNPIEPSNPGLVHLIYILNRDAFY